LRSRKIKTSKYNWYEGVFIDSYKNVYIVMEFISLGSLNTFLQKEGSKLTILDLVGMAQQAASGMTHLETSRIIHRDLALRNLLVDKVPDGYVIKISDFGLSRSVENSYYTIQDSQIPIKWSAPEVLQYGTHSTKSDIYSFSVLLWELFNYGKLPYAEYTNQNARVQILKGSLLPYSKSCPPDIFNLMTRCWKMKTEERPNFSQVYDEISRVHESMKTSSHPVSGKQYQFSRSKNSDNFYGGFVSVQ